VLRDAVLSFTLSEGFCKELLHWRTSRPHVYAHSALNAADDAGFTGGVPLGAPLRNVRLGADDHLYDHVGRGFRLLAFTGPAGPDAALETVLRAAAEAPVPVACLLVAPRALPGRAETVVVDPAGRVAALYDAPPGSACLVRPDTHVCARWRQPTPALLRAALDTACGRR
jgi:3-(3-hydroxy-phenyl)propionate hydroxylase